MEKMKKTAKILIVLLNIVFWVLVVSSVFALIVSVAVPFLPNGYIDYVSNSITLGPITLNLASNIIQQKALFYIGVFCIVLILIPSIFFVLLLKKLLLPISQGEPFAKNISNTLKKLAFLTLVIGAIETIFGIVMETFIYQAFDLGKILLNEHIASVSMSPQIDVNFLVFAAVLFLLSYIFRYGEELQQLSDETL